MEARNEAKFIFIQRVRHVLSKISLNTIKEEDAVELTPMTRDGNEIDPSTIQGTINNRQDTFFEEVKDNQEKSGNWVAENFDLFVNFNEDRNDINWDENAGCVNGRYGFPKNNSPEIFLEKEAENVNKENDESISKTEPQALDLSLGVNENSNDINWEGNAEHVDDRYYFPENNEPEVNLEKNVEEEVYNFNEENNESITKTATKTFDLSLHVNEREGNAEHVDGRYYFPENNEPEVNLEKNVEEDVYNSNEENNEPMTKTANEREGNAEYVDDRYCFPENNEPEVHLEKKVDEEANNANEENDESIINAAIKAIDFFLNLNEDHNDINWKQNNVNNANEENYKSLAKNTIKALDLCLKLKDNRNDISGKENAVYDGNRYYSSENNVQPEHLAHSIERKINKANEENCDDIRKSANTNSFLTDSDALESKNNNVENYVWMDNDRDTIKCEMVPWYNKPNSDQVTDSNRKINHKHAVETNTPNHDGKSNIGNLQHINTTGLKEVTPTTDTENSMTINVRDTSSPIKQKTINKREERYLSDDDNKDDVINVYNIPNGTVFEVIKEKKGKCPKEKDCGDKSPATNNINYENQEGAVALDDILNRDTFYEVPLASSYENENSFEASDKYEVCEDENGISDWRIELATIDEEEPSAQKYWFDIQPHIHPSLDTYSSEEELDKSGGQTIRVKVDIVAQSPKITGSIPKRYTDDQRFDFKDKQRRIPAPHKTDYDTIEVVHENKKSKKNNKTETHYKNQTIAVAYKGVIIPCKYCGILLTKDNNSQMGALKRAVNNDSSSFEDFYVHKCAEMRKEQGLLRARKSLELQLVHTDAVEELDYCLPNETIVKKSKNLQGTSKLTLIEEEDKMELNFDSQNKKNSDTFASKSLAESSQEDETNQEFSLGTKVKYFAETCAKYITPRVLFRAAKQPESNNQDVESCIIETENNNSTLVSQEPQESVQNAQEQHSSPNITKCRVCGNFCDNFSCTGEKAIVKILAVQLPIQIAKSQKFLVGLCHVCDENLEKCSAFLLNYLLDRVTLQHRTHKKECLTCGCSMRKLLERPSRRTMKKLITILQVHNLCDRTDFYIRKPYLCLRCERDVQLVYAQRELVWATNKIFHQEYLDLIAAGEEEIEPEPVPNPQERPYGLAYYCNFVGAARKLITTTIATVWGTTKPPEHNYKIVGFEELYEIMRALSDTEFNEADLGQTPANQLFLTILHRYLSFDSHFVTSRSTQKRK